MFLQLHGRETRIKRIVEGRDEALLAAGKAGLLRF
jgi:hypothetical protein